MLAICANLLLFGLKYRIAALSCNIALDAEALHSFLRCHHLFHGVRRINHRPQIQVVPLWALQGIKNRSDTQVTDIRNIFVHDEIGPPISASLLRRHYLMNMATIENFKLKLSKRKQELVDRLSSLEHNLRIPEEHSIELLEKAKLETGTLMNIKWEDRDARLLLKINQALDRIQTGSYGTCIMCGQPISLRRLEILPETTICQKCAHQIEDQ